MRPRTVLLVEDSANDAELAKVAFGRSRVPLHLVIAEDGADALDYLLGGGPHGAGRPSELPDFLLLDLKLPGMDGFEILRRLRSERRTAVLPVIVFTSSVEAQDVSSSYRLGASSYVRKPVDFDEFLHVAEVIVDYWLGINQAAPKDAAP